MNDMTLPPTGTAYDAVVEDICRLNWSGLDQSDVSAVAWAYYFFSIQFRENLRLAQQLRPDDPALGRLVAEECDTDNLSPWPGVAEAGERLNHDEFMRRVLALSPIEPAAQRRVEQAGQRYLAGIRAMDTPTRGRPASPATRTAAWSASSGRSSTARAGTRRCCKGFGTSWSSTSGSTATPTRGTGRWSGTFRQTSAWLSPGRRCTGSS